MSHLSRLAGLEVAEIYLSCGWLGGWVVGWVARQNGNNAKLSPKLKLKLKLKLCLAELGKNDFQLSMERKARSYEKMSCHPSSE